MSQLCIEQNQKLQTAATDCKWVDCICFGPAVRNVIGCCTVPYPSSDFSKFVGSGTLLVALHVLVADSLFRSIYVIHMTENVNLIMLITAKKFYTYFLFY